MAVHNISITLNTSSTFVGSTVTAPTSAVTGDIIRLTVFTNHAFVRYTQSGFSGGSLVQSFVGSSGSVTRDFTITATSASPNFSIECRALQTLFSQSFTHFGKLTGAVAVSLSGTASISGGTNIRAGENRTLTYNVNTAGTYYYNSTGADSHPRMTPKKNTSGTASGAGANVTVSLTAQEPQNTASVPQQSLAVAYTIRQNGSGGTPVPGATTATHRVFHTPSTPTAISFSNVTTTSITATASGSSNSSTNFGNLQVSIDNSTFHNSPHTFTGLTAGQSYTFYARRLNTVAFSPNKTATQSTLGNAATAPTLSGGSPEFYSTGVFLTVTPSGGNYANIQYQWVATGNGVTNATQFAYGVEDNQIGLGIRYGLGANGYEWLGSTWKCTARVSLASSPTTYVYSNEVTIQVPGKPSVNYFGNLASLGVDEGSLATIGYSGGNVWGGRTIYYTLTPSNQFDASVVEGSMTLNASGGGTFYFTPLADNTTESSHPAGRLRTYATSSKNETYQKLTDNTFQINDTSQGSTITAPVVNTTGHTYTTVSDTFRGYKDAYVNIQLSSGGSGGTLYYNASTSSGYPSSGWKLSTSYLNGITPITVERGQSYHYFARRSSTQWDSEGPFTVPLMDSAAQSDKTLLFSSPTFTSGNTIIQDSVSSLTLTFSGAGEHQQYRVLKFLPAGDTATHSFIISGQKYQWIYSSNIISYGASSLSVTLTNTMTANSWEGLPPDAGEVFTYKIQTRIPSTKGGDAVWVDCTVGGLSTFTITRASEFTLATLNGSTASSSFNEGQTITYKVTYPTGTGAPPNGTVVGYKLENLGEGNVTSGSNAGTFNTVNGVPTFTGTITLNNGVGEKDITIINDNLDQPNLDGTAGRPFAVFTLNDNTNGSPSFSTGGPSVETTVILDETSSSGTGDPTSGGSGNYGIKIFKPGTSTVILDSNSRVTNILSSTQATFDSTSGNTITKFQGFDCSDSATTGIISTWDGQIYAHPIITRSSNGITLTRYGTNQSYGGSFASDGTLTLTLVRY
tara:strand:+ start:160 stop:3228 length:3069 start_codon:yes stop_codon:yes gene_type:complete